MPPSAKLPETWGRPVQTSTTQREETNPHDSAEANPRVPQRMEQEEREFIPVTHNGKGKKGKGKAGPPQVNLTPASYASAAASAANTSQPAPAPKTTD